MSFHTYAARYFHPLNTAASFTFLALDVDTQNSAIDFE